ncbi:pyruvate dehydrogenase phosphatase regulatory subunit, mitochondrial [Planococcus citri]|uniref:pyruvate dehydrogenase phosphatase regulatory subunit, mitochondrial n=1 Tax=Planococcus citri TaxID=170843 RepID=UPI0031F78975
MNLSMFRYRIGGVLDVKKCSSTTKRYLSYDFYDENELRVPKKASVVICGGGVTGASVAYHLAEIGWGPQTIVIDQGKLGGGMTWYSSGLVSVFKSSYTQVKLCQATFKLYEELVSKGHDIGWKQCGSLSIARTLDRMAVFKRMKSQTESWGIECELVTPQQIEKICPMINSSDLKGGLWIPKDGTADPYKICLTLFKIAQSKGVKVFEDCAIQQVFSRDGHVRAIESTKGVIECDYFVNCGGIWARKIGQLSEPRVKVPVHPVEHYYLITKPIPGLDPLTPVVRDQDGYVYFREHDGCLLAGGYEPQAKPLFDDGKIPEHFHTVKMESDWDHFYVLLEQLMNRIPSLGDAVIDKLINSPETFSPDCKWIIGEASEIQNYFVAAGMKTVGISAAGGTGKTIVDWIVHGSPDDDLYELEISRFLALHNNLKFLRDRVKEVPGLHYAIPYPHMEFKTGRNLRMSPIYPKLKEAGAVFGQVMGYERPLWFDSNSMEENEENVAEIKQVRNTFCKPAYFDAVNDEYTACREAVGLIDYSSYTKIDLWSKGKEVVDALQYLCSNDVDVPIGSIIHTGLQNERGGYENDCSLVRIAENLYMMISPTIQQTRCKAWLEKHLPKDGSVNYSDVTSMFTAICIVGPFSRQLLAELTETDLSPKSFPFFTHKEIDVGLANGIRTMNITHTGELGYVLYIPNEFALHVYNCLLEAGQKYGIRRAGYYAMKALRVEKFYAFWGQDLDTTTTPLECGRSWRVKFDKGIDFIGKDALLRQREEGVKRMYVQLILNDHDAEVDPWCWGNEPIYRDDKYVGAVTTTSYGFTFKKQVCLGFIQNLDSNKRPLMVSNDYVLSGTYEVDIAGVRYSAKVNLHSPILPTKYPDKERESYFATRDKMVPEPLLRQV